MCYRFLDSSGAMGSYTNSRWADLTERSNDGSVGMQEITIDSTQWVDTLMAGASQLGIELSSEQALQLNQYALLILTWNRKINLTTITDPVQIAVKHFIDSIAPLAHLSQDGESSIWAPEAGSREFL